MKKLIIFLKVFISLILFLTLSITILNIVPFSLGKIKKENSFRVKKDYPLIIPHGGAKMLVPENTIYAYDMLVNEYSVDVLEIDLVLTKDNILISHHDLDLGLSSEVLNDNKYIRDYTYSEILDLYKLDDYKVARNFIDINGIKPFLNETKEEVLSKMVPESLENIFTKNQGNILYMLEIKDSPTSIGYIEGSDRFLLAAKNLIDLVKKFDLESKVVLASFSDDVTKYFKEKAPNILVGAAIDEVTNFAILSAFNLDFFFKPKSEVLILPVPSSMKLPSNMNKILNNIPQIFRKNIAVKVEDDYLIYLTHKQIVKDAHRKNLSVVYWTVNDKDQMRMLIKLGVDGIITDRPDLLIEIINELKNK